MDKYQDKIYRKICKIAGTSVNSKKLIKEGLVFKALNKIEKEFAQNKILQQVSNNRINNILNTVEAYAKLQFNKKSFVGVKGNAFDALASGINMLGEELKSSTVSLNEKEVLLKEVHHRVKNNLQIISSLLSLQMDGITDKKTVDFFANNNRRIKSMALVHETLYQSKNISEVNFANYLNVLINSIKSSYSNGKPIRIILKAQPHNLKVDTAIPCGLIINELLTNSYKYAFDGKPEGEIMLEFKRENNKGKAAQYKLNICDNGIGLPKKFDIHKTTTLGLQLVSILTEQLDGSLSLESKNGTSFKILFPC